MYKIIILIIISQALAEQNENYETKEITNNGILFEKFAKAAIWEESYNIITTIEIPDSTQAIEEITQYYTTMKDLCDHVTKTPNHPCQILVKKSTTKSQKQSTTSSPSNTTRELNED